MHPNKTYQDRDNSNVRNMIIRHLENDVVHGSIKGKQDKGDNCKFRDSYTNLEHLRMLSYSWMKEGTAIAPLNREHFILAASHGMLLRGEDLRGLVFANCFIQQIPKGRLDNQAVHMMTFVMEEGKTIVGERKEYAGAVRHEDVRRCVVGAFAFYVFDRFHVSSRLGWNLCQMFKFRGKYSARTRQNFSHLYLYQCHYKLLLEQGREIH